MAYDLLVKGGQVVDPSQGLNAVQDVALSDGKVAAIQASIPESQATNVLDANGLLVTPGLLDMHVHVYWGVSHYGVDADATCLQKGVTTVLDTGSSGAQTFPGFRHFIIERAQTRIYALLNISTMGMLYEKIGELQDMRWADVEAAVARGQEHRDVVLGIKVRLSPHMVGQQDVEALSRAREAATALGTPLMVHIGGTYTPLEKHLARLRPGDIVTHTFHDRGNGVLDDKGKVVDAVWEAQRRGVVFDIGHGRGSFSFRVAEQVLSQGFYPGSISSDLHVHNLHGPVYDQVTVLSKFLHLGMSVDDVIQKTTQAPAQAMGKADTLGTLRVGATGDVAVLRLEEGDFLFTDSYGGTVHGTRRLVPVHTIKGGHLVRAPTAVAGS